MSRTRAEAPKDEGEDMSIHATFFDCQTGKAIGDIIRWRRAETKNREGGVIKGGKT